MGDKAFIDSFLAEKRVCRFSVTRENGGQIIRLNDGGILVTLKTYGSMAVDLEERVNFDRLRTERLGRRLAFLGGNLLGRPAVRGMGNPQAVPPHHPRADAAAYSQRGSPLHPHRRHVLRLRVH